MTAALKFTVDHDRIDGDLTNVPIPLNIGTGVGISTFDASDFFDEMMYPGHPDADDEFTGTDGDDPDFDRWLIDNQSATGTSLISSNAFRLSIPNTANDEKIFVYGNFEIEGDFDIQIDYAEISNDAPSSSMSYPAQLRIDTEDGTIIGVYTRFHPTLGHFMLIESTTDGQTIGTVLYSTGKFRITRTGSTFTAYVWSGSQWEWEGNTNGYTFTDSDSSNIVPRISIVADYDSGVTTDFDNFLINSGNVIWPLMADRFIGPDGEWPDPVMWSDDGTIQDNKLNYAVNSSSETTESLFNLSGDFDIQIDFDCTGAPSTDMWDAGVKIIPTDSDDDLVICYRRYNSTNSHHVLGNVKTLGSWGTEVDVAHTDLVGKLRITRVGNLFSTYYHNGTSWTLLHASTNTGFSTETKIQFWGRTTIASDISLNIDNFIATSGNVIWPNGEPNRKKIKIFTSDMATELFAEIEPNANFSNKRIVYHAKLPDLTAATDDVYYLAYDKTWGDNNNYIGDTGEYTLVSISGDDFTGDDTDSPDAYLWDKKVDFWNGGLCDYDVDIQSNALSIRSTSVVNGHYGNVSSMYRMSGDFDIQIDLDLTNGNTIGDETYLYMWDDLDNRGYLGDRAGELKTDQKVAGVWQGGITDTRSGDILKLKLVRIGSDCSAYFDDGSGWELLGTVTCVTTDVNIVLHHTADRVGSETFFDNFLINSGNILYSPAQNVWDFHFKLVYLLAQGTTGSLNVIDSTSNGNNGSTQGGMTLDDLVDGLGGKAFDFEGNDDAIHLSANTIIDDLPIKTLEALIKLDAQTGTGPGSHIFNKGQWFLATDPSNSRNLFGTNFSGTVGRWSFPQFALSEWLSLVTTYDNQLDSNDPVIYLSGVSQTLTEYSTPVGTAIAESSALFMANQAAQDRGLDGLVGIIRISDIERSASWVRATSESLEDNLFTVEATEVTLAQDPWYGDYSDREKFTINGDKISSDLTHFPLSVVLGASNKQYHDSVITPDDDFIGGDNEAPHPKWNVYTVGTYIKNNHLHQHVDSGSGGINQSMGCDLRIDGDFNVVVSWNYDYDPGPRGYWLQFVCLGSGWNDTIGRDNNLGGDRILSRRDNGEVQGITYPGFYGSFRFIRTGSNLYHYYLADTGWVLHYTSARDTSQVYFAFNCGHYSSNPAVDANWDNFRVLTGACSGLGNPTNVVKVYSNANDTSKIFDELRLTTVDDDFTGTNGDTPNSDLWNNSNFTIQDNRLYYSGVSSWVRSKYDLTGDIDFQTDFALYTTPAIDSYTMRLLFRSQDAFGNWQFIEVERKYGGGSVAYWMYSYIQGFWKEIGSATTSDTSGKLRLVRVGTKWTGYYWTGSAWASLGTWDGLYDDGHVSLEHGSWSSSPSFEGSFDNFQLNVGTPYWANGGPNMNKMAIAAADGTPLYIERETYQEGYLPFVTRDIGSEQDGLSIYSLVGSPVDNGDYYTFNGVDNYLESGVNVLHEGYLDIKARFRIHDKTHSGTIWISGGTTQGISIGLDGVGGLGIVGYNSANRSGILIANSYIEENVWYVLKASKTKVDLIVEHNNTVIRLTGLCRSGDGTGTEAIGSGTIMVEGVRDYFEGDIDYVHVYAESKSDREICGDPYAVFHTSRSDWVVQSGTDENIYFYYDKEQPDNIEYLGDTGDTEGNLIEAPSFTGDNFTGTDGDSPDENLWDVDVALWGSTDGYVVPTTIQSNKLEMGNDQLVTMGRGNVVSLFKLSGDFSCEVDWAVNDPDAELTMYIWKDTSNTNDRSYIGIETGIIRANNMVGSSWEGEVNVARTNDYGKFKVDRAGNTLTVSYQDGAQSWQVLYTPSWMSDDCQIVLFAGSYVITTSTFDNLFISSGTVLIPARPSFKVWDANYISAYNMVKNPAVPFAPHTLILDELSASGTTASIWDLSIYNDLTGISKANGLVRVDLKCSNWSIVTSSQLEISSSLSADTNEWYCNVGVDLTLTSAWQTFYIPLSTFVTSGGEPDLSAITRVRFYAVASSSITLYIRNLQVQYLDLPFLDSTSNVNDGTPDRSMSLNNLVDGSIGKAVDFDGVDDGVLIKNSSVLDDLALGDFTIEAIINPRTSDGNYGRIAEKRKSGSEGGWLFFEDSTNSIGFQNKSAAGVTDAEQRGDDDAIVLDESQFVSLTYSDTGDRQGHLKVNESEIAYDINTIGTGVIGTDVGNDLIIGNREDTNSSFDGLISAIRFSDIIRSEAWLDATSYSLQDELITYSIAQTTLDPFMDPLSGQYLMDQLITLTCLSAGAIIYYTTDGSDPDITDTEYTVPLLISHDLNLKAIAQAEGSEVSGIADETYTTAQTATPVILPPSGEYEYGQVATISCSTAGSAIYYTLDGSIPDETDILYTGVIPVIDGLTIRAIAITTNYRDSELASESYNIKPSQPILNIIT